MTDSREPKEIAAKAVHMIASVEPALDTAIDRFACDTPGLSEIPARETILRELRGVIEEVIGADNNVLPVEIGSYSQLLQIIDVASRRTIEVSTMAYAGNAAGGTQADLSVARLLARLDSAESTNFSRLYQAGVAALVRYLAAVDGEISSEEYALVERYEPKDIR